MRFPLFLSSRVSLCPWQAIFIYTLTDITPTEYNGYKFPWWADMLGWMMGASTLVPFIVGIAYRYYKDKPVSGLL